MDELVERAEEMGVQELWVLETKRTVAKMHSEAKERARRRWERIVVEAAKQSGSPVLTEVIGPISFEEALNEKLESSDRAYLFHPGTRSLPFSGFVEELRWAGAKEVSRSVTLFFGPEGGFSEDEVRLAESRGIQKVSLGDSILRLETAFVAVIGALRFLLS